MLKLSMTEKLAGYILLATGVVVILLSGFNVYQVFTKKAPPVQLFSFDAISIDAMQLLGGDMTPEERAYAKAQVGSAQLEIMSAAMINDTSNILAHVVLMGFIASVGMRLATIGTYLVRTIHVHVKEAK